MGFFSGLWNAITGRNRDQEQDLYANYQMVDTVVGELNSIASTKVMGASDEVCNAMKAINKVKGMEQFVGTISVSNFETAFDTISDTIKDIALQLEGKAEEIKRYEEASPWEKATSTFAMGATKFAEGLLTPFEEIGDFAVGVVGWLAPKDSGVEKWCTEFVKKDWAHDAFNFYYNSEFADKSVFKEEGLASNLFLLGGKTLSLVSTMSTVGPTALALSGWGSGTETGVKNGKSINSAFWTDGLLGAALQVGGGLLPVGIPGAVALFPGAAVNQYRNQKATQKMNEMAPTVEIKEAVPGTIFETVPPTGGGTGPVPPTTEPGTGPEPPTTDPGGGGGQQHREETTEPKTEAKTEAKTEPKTEAKTEAKTEPKTEAKTEPKTEAKTEPKTEYRPPVQPTGNTPQTEWHGGEYGEGGYVSDTTEGLDPLDESLLDGTTSISDILDGKSITKVKTNAPISNKSTTSSSSKVIPIAAGLSAAAAAGIGAKAYLDSRENNDMDEEDDEEEFEEVDWSDEENLSGETYSQPVTSDSTEEFELNETNNYYEDNNEGYSARNNEELAELQ